MNPTEASRSAATPAAVERLLEEARRIRHQDTRRALAFCREAEALALGIGHPNGYAHALLLGGLCLAILGGERDRALASLRQALDLLEALGDLAGQGEALNLMATLHADQEDFVAAIPLHQRALQIRRLAKDRLGESGSLLNLGLVYRDQSQFAEGLKHFFTSLEIAEELGHVQVQAYAKQSIGDTLGQLGDSEQAMVYLRDALQLITQTADRAHESTVLTRLGGLLLDTHRPREALTHLMRARELARATGNAGDLGEALLGLGRLRQRAGALAVAQHFFEEAAGWMQKAGMRRGHAEVALEMGRNEWLGGAFEPAVRHLDAALLAIEGRPSERLRGKVHQLLSEMHESRSEHEAALQHFKAFHAFEQRIFKEDNQRRVRALLERTNLERAQREAEWARRRSEELGLALDATKLADQTQDAAAAQPSQDRGARGQPHRDDVHTGLANRHGLDARDALDRERERARDKQQPLGVALVEVDHFKGIIDRCGRRVGDEVMRRLGFLLRQAFRAEDIVARHGAETFMAVLVEMPLASAAVLCERLRERAAGMSWSDLHPDLQQVTVSIGLAGVAEDPMAVDLEALARRQLDAAKTRGHNRVCWLGPQA